jgi:hypothetical protein
MAWFIPLLIGIALSVVSYLLQPKPKQPKPPAASDLESPTAEAGRPIPVIFGTMTIKGVNTLWYGDKQVRAYKVTVPS